MAIKNLVFDFGGVLVDWNPVHLYQDVFSNQTEMEFFLKDICPYSWNLNQDRGYPVAEATRERQLLFPQYEKEIAMYYGEWPRMISGDLPENTRLLSSLKENYRLFGLSNWSAETFPYIYDRYDFFKEMEGIVLSGREKMLKPDRAFYELLLNRYELVANECLFVDDNLDNILAAQALGFSTIHLKEGVVLEEEFQKLGIL